jgi:hypothetical protein
MRALLLFLALLHLGPGAAFALLAFGCDALQPALGSGLCEMHMLRAFAWMTLGAWLLMGLGLLAIRLLQRARALPSPAHGARLLALLALLALGVLLAAAGHLLFGGTAWVLALPATLAAGWLVLANPAACLPGADGPAPR